jgi:hypothetical protein
VLWIRIAFNADLWIRIAFNADPDSDTEFFVNADPDPDPGF